MNVHVSVVLFLKATWIREKPPWIKHLSDKVYSMNLETWQRLRQNTEDHIKIFLLLLVLLGIKYQFFLTELGFSGLHGREQRSRTERFSITKDSSSSDIALCNLY